ncbi:MAG: thermonuclease family protein [Candidatus Omnitrophica bacterium]|nr:thermonuclease family protein [Candidatus Omnitrophota bacterium]
MNALMSYGQLRFKVKETLLEGQQKIEQQKVITYWQTGKHLHEHIFLHEGRAEHYGKDVIERLSGDLDVSETLLYRALQFFRSFKNLAARPNSFLSWAHYRAAMRIPDESKRLKLIEQASKEEWTSRELEIEVRNRNWSEHISQSDGRKPVQLPAVSLGPFHTYKIIRPETIHSGKMELLIDLGFSMKKELSLFQEKFPAGTIVTSVKHARGFILQAVTSLVSKKEEDLLYTYKAYVTEVIDGDTLKVDFRLGFGDRKGETIRLNSIDCPEMDTPEGRAAKRFVEARLSGCEFITVKSIRTRKEKWGRYLGHVFFEKKQSGRVYNPVGNDKISTGSTQATRLEYLNQLLLDKGHAVRVRSQAELIKI